MIIGYYFQEVSFHPFLYNTNNYKLYRFMTFKYNKIYTFRQINICSMNMILKVQLIILVHYTRLRMPFFFSHHSPFDSCIFYSLLTIIVCPKIRLCMPFFAQYHFFFLQVFHFLCTYAIKIDVCAFTLDEFAQAFHDKVCSHFNAICF